MLGIELPSLGAAYRLPVNSYSFVDQGEALLALPAGLLMNASIPLADFMERSGINDWLMAMPPNAAGAIEAGIMAAAREARALARLAREAAKAAEEAAALAKCAAKGGSGLGNPFKGKAAAEIDEMFKAKGFQPRGTDPVNGFGGYVNPQTGRSYHIDPKNSFNEPFHVDVNRLKTYNGPLEKKKYFTGD